MNPSGRLLQRPLRRPLSNAHWSLTLALVAAWCLFAFGRSCGSPAREGALALFASTVLIVSWASHLRAQAFTGWRKLAEVAAGAAYDLLLLLIATVACSIPLALVTSTEDCMTPRARADILILSASSARTQVEARAAQGGTLKGAGVGIAVEAAPGASVSLVSDDGVIFLAGGDPAAVVVFRPTLVGGQVTWNCKGFPARLMPAPCR